MRPAGFCSGQGGTDEFRAARWALAHLGGWTWLVAEYRLWLIMLATVTGLAVPLLVAARKPLPRPAPSLVIRSGALALAFSAAMVTICSLLHVSDLRWLVPGQRAAAHLSAPRGLFGVGKPVVSVINSIAGIPVEYRATRCQSTPLSPARSWRWRPSSWWP